MATKKLKPSDAKPAVSAEEEHARRAADWDKRLMARLRKICMAYPGVVEVKQFGGPWWKAGKKSFCTYGAESVKVDGVWRGRDGAAFNVSLMEQAQLVKDPRFERTHYVGQHGWTTMNFGKKLDWEEVEQLVEDAYRKVAAKKLLAELDAKA